MVEISNIVFWGVAAFVLFLMLSTLWDMAKKKKETITPPKPEEKKE